jgi:signal transduction histidine kinase
LVIDSRDFFELSSYQKLPEEKYRDNILSRLGENAAALIHELRNPLQSIRAMLQMLERELDACDEGMNVTAKERFFMLYDELERAGGLLSEFLCLSSRMSSNVVSGSLADLVMQILPLLRSMSILRGVNINVECNGDSLNCLFDEQRIKQVIINLVSNALDALTRGGHINITLFRDKDMAVVSIEDDGAGMDNAAIAKIFEPFYTSKDTGTGLGLSICAQIADQHKGYITAKSMRGIGSVFALYLPIGE